MAKDNTRSLVDIGQDFFLRIGLSRIASWDTKSRPKKALRGTFGFNTQTNNLEYWNGDVWLTAPMSRD